MTFEQAASAIVSLVGSGGVVAGFVAWMGHRTEVMKGRRGDPDGRVVAMQVSSAPSFAECKELELLANAMTTLATAITQLATVAQETADQAEIDREAKERAAVMVMRNFVDKHGLDMKARD